VRTLSDWLLVCLLAGATLVVLALCAPSLSHGGQVGPMKRTRIDTSLRVAPRLAVTYLDVNPSDVSAIPTPTGRFRVNEDGTWTASGFRCWTQQGASAPAVVGIADHVDGGSFAWPDGSYPTGITKALKLNGTNQVITCEDPGPCNGDWAFLLAGIGAPDANTGVLWSKDQGGYGGPRGAVLYAQTANNQLNLTLRNPAAGYTQLYTGAEAFGPPGQPHILVGAYHAVADASSVVSWMMDGAAITGSSAAKWPALAARTPIRIGNYGMEPAATYYGSGFWSGAVAEYAYWCGWSPNSATQSMMSSGVTPGTSTTGTYPVKLPSKEAIALTTVAAPASTWAQAKFLRTLGRYAGDTNSISIQTTATRTLKCSVYDAAGQYIVAETAAQSATWDVGPQSHEIGCRVTPDAVAMWIDRTPAAVTLTRSQIPPVTLGALPAQDNVGMGTQNWVGTITRAAECSPQFVSGTCPLLPAGNANACCSLPMTGQPNAWLAYFGDSTMQDNYTDGTIVTGRTLLTNALGGLNTPWGVAALGLAGEQTAAGLTRYQGSVSGHAFGYAAILEGTNDCHFLSDSAAVIEARLESIYAAATANGETTVIALTPGASCPADHTPQLCNLALRNVLWTACQVHPEWHCIDWFAYTDDNSANHCCRAGLCLADGTHNTQYGVALKAALVLDKLKSLDSTATGTIINPNDGGIPVTPPPVPLCYPSDGGYGVASNDGGCPP